jgi:hypothetical protein
MRRWLDPGWYRYLAARYPDRAAIAAIVVLGLLALGGYAAVTAAGGGGTEPASTGAFGPITTTVMRTVKAFEKGHVVVKRVPVVKTIAPRQVTVLATSTIKTPGGTKIVTTSRYRTVRDVVTTKRVLTNTRFATVTNERTNTTVQTETQTATATVTRTATATPDTVTVAGPTVTATVTNHVTTTVTATLPVVTVTVTVTAPRTTP